MLLLVRLGLLLLFLSHGLVLLLFLGLGFLFLLLFLLTLGLLLSLLLLLLLGLDFLFLLLFLLTLGLLLSLLLLLLLGLAFFFLLLFLLTLGLLLSLLLLLLLGLDFLFLLLFLLTLGLLLSLLLLLLLGLGFLFLLLFLLTLVLLLSLLLLLLGLDFLLLLLLLLLGLGLRLLLGLSLFLLFRLGLLLFLRLGFLLLFRGLRALFLFLLACEGRNSKSQKQEECRGTESSKRFHDVAFLIAYPCARQSTTATRFFLPNDNLVRESRRWTAPFIAKCLRTHVDTRERVEKTKNVEEPKDHGDDDDGVQDGLDAAGHGDETIHQPQENAHNDQGEQNLNKRHGHCSFPTVQRDTSSLASEIASSAGWSGEPNEPLALCKSPNCLSGQSVRLDCRAMSLTLVKTEGNKHWGWTVERTSPFTAN